MFFRVIMSVRVRVTVTVVWKERKRRAFVCGVV